MKIVMAVYQNGTEAPAGNPHLDRTPRRLHLRRRLLVESPIQLLRRIHRHHNLVGVHRRQPPQARRVTLTSIDSVLVRWDLERFHVFPQQLVEFGTIEPAVADQRDNHLSRVVWIP